MLIYLVLPYCAYKQSLKGLIGIVVGKLMLLPKALSSIGFAISLVVLICFSPSMIRVATNIKQLIKNTRFGALINKIKNGINSWQTPLLSQVGRNILIKSIASAIPIYNMYVLQLPNKTTNTMDGIFRILEGGKWE